MTRMGPFLLYAAICIGVPQAVSGQIRASERSTVTQTIDGTTITVDYGRVQRNDILGSEVAWGDVWTAGANWATYLDVSEGITLDGHRLRQGKYMVWIDVEADDWTVIFDPSARGCEVIPPPTSPGQVRFAIEPTHGTPYSEFLTWSFPVVRPTGGVLHVSWSTTTVDFEIGVTPSRPFTVDHDLAEQYLGTYSLELGPQLGGGEMEFSIRYEDSRLMASWKNPPNPRLGEIWLLHLGAGMFVPVELENDEVFDVVDEIVFEFSPPDGPDGSATKFELRAASNDELWGEATRLP